MVHSTEINNIKGLQILRIKILHSCQSKNYWSYRYLSFPFQSETKPVNLLYDNGLHGTLEFNEDIPIITKANSPHLHA